MTDDVKPYDDDFMGLGAAAPAGEDIFARIAESYATRPRSLRPGPPPRRGRFDGRTMHFGKYSGTAVEEVPLGYIAWIFDEVLSGEMAQPEAFLDSLARSFVARASEVPAFKRALPRIAGERRGGRAPVVTGGEEV